MKLGFWIQDSTKTLQVEYVLPPPGVHRSGKGSINKEDLWAC